MGQYDKEIAAAKKIGDGWIKESEHYQAQYTLIKKEHLKLEKGALKKIQADLQNSPDEDTLKAHRDEIESIKERLDMFIREGERLNKEHAEWALGDPRSNMRFINQKLKLGDSSSEAYLEVSKGIKRQLTEVANTIKATQRAWSNDLKYALETEKSRLESLEGILDGTERRHVAYIKQIKTEVARFIAFCDKAWSSIDDKLGSHARDFADAKAGKLDDKAKTKLQQQFQLYESRAVEIPKLMDMIEKNHKRALKSVPKQFLDGFMTSAEKKAMEEKKAAILKKMNLAIKFYNQAMATYQSANLV